MWEEHTQYWSGEEAGVYKDLAVLAKFVVDSYGECEVEVVRGALDLVEEILEEPDPQARELLVVGLLEDIQIIGSNREFGASVFEPFLGPLSLAGWREIESMWEGKSNLMDVLRRELDEET